MRSIRVPLELTVRLVDDARAVDILVMGICCVHEIRACDPASLSFVDLAKI